MQRPRLGDSRSYLLIESKDLVEIQVKLAQQSHIFVQFGGIAGCLVVRDVGDEVAVPSLQLIYDHSQLTDGQHHLPSINLLLLA